MTSDASLHEDISFFSPDNSNNYTSGCIMSLQVSTLRTMAWQKVIYKIAAF